MRIKLQRGRSAPTSRPIVMPLRRPSAIGASLVGVLGLLTIVMVLTFWSVWWRSPYRVVERWLASRGEVAVAGIGNTADLPFDIDIYPVTYLASEGCDFLDLRQPEALLFERGAIEKKAAAVFERFEFGEFNYDLVLSVEADMLTRFVDRLMNRHSRELRVYERYDRPCLSGDDPFPYIRVLQQTGDLRLRQTLAAAIRRHPIPGKKSLGGAAAEIQALGLSFDGWTRGTEAGAVVYSNSSDSESAPLLVVGCQAPQAALPVSVTIDDGVQRQHLVFDSRGRRTLTLPTLAPGKSRLVLVWTDKAWQPASNDGRWLGVSVIQAGFTTAPGT